MDRWIEENAKVSGGIGRMNEEERKNCERIDKIKENEFEMNGWILNEWMNEFEMNG